jgi:thioredoxin 1
MSAPPPPDAPLLVACLCAGWCRTCDAYRDTFDALAREFGAHTRFVWVDIEDDDALLGDLDIQNFPTLLLAAEDEVRFFGTVTPQTQTARQLVQRARAAELRVLRDPALDGLPARLRARG